MKKILNLLLLTTTAIVNCSDVSTRIQETATEHAQDVVQAFLKESGDQAPLFFKKLQRILQNQNQEISGKENQWQRPCSSHGSRRAADSALDYADQVFKTFDKEEKEELLRIFYAHIKASLTSAEFEVISRPLTPRL